MKALALVLLLADPSWAYRGCLFFQDDVRPGDDFSLMDALKPDMLIRSWYRFGEPPADKAYELRAKLVAELARKNVLLGGGTSLSVVNDRDLARPDFDPSWLATTLDGKVFEKDGRKFASLSAPGFRSYLVRRLVEQARLGVGELALGETNGKILFDDWTLGLKGGDGFVQWLKRKYPERYDDKLSRESFQDFARFQSEWGRPDSWHGTNKEGQPAFLAYLYRRNLESLLKELRAALEKNGLGPVLVDVWGSADWSRALSPMPDAVLDAPPGERWGFSWNTDPRFDVEKNRERIKEAMLDEVRAATPARLVFMFDHPTPFLDSFVGLPDARQAYLTRFFAELSGEVGAGFALRGYSEIPGGPGPETKGALLELCARRRAPLDLVK